MTRTPYPKVVTLETTLRCNLRCIHCCSHLRRMEFNKDMSPEILEKAMEIIKHADSVSLDNQGEFFCNDDYLSIFRRVRDMGKKTTITTNGMLVDDNIIDNVIFDGLTNLNFSVDAVDAATHTSFRKGSDFNKLIATIRKVFERRSALKTKQPFIALSFVVRRNNIEDLPAMVDFCNKLGADQMYIYHLFVFDKKLENECLFHHKELSDKYFKKAIKRNKNSSMILVMPSLFEEYASKGQARISECRYPWEEVCISANGEVLACCDWRLVMGDLNEQTFDEIWNGENYRELRRTVNVSGAHPHCANCPHPLLSNPTNPKVFFDFDRKPPK